MNGVDRVFKLTPMVGKNTMTPSGSVDNRLFSGENRLHAIMDTKTCLWSLKYDSGILHGGLKQQFTGFNKLFKYITDYYNKRNVRVEEDLNASANS